MAESGFADDTIRARLVIWDRLGRNTSAAAREIGVTRSVMQHVLRAAEERGMLDLAVRPHANPPKGRETGDLIAARKAEFERRRRHGDWRKPVLVDLRRPGPFMLVALGDPHLDNPGSDLDLWERWTGVLDRHAGIYGVCIGDYLDNWVRVLGHLYGESSTTAPEGWTLLEHYLETMGRDLIGSCSGNHDDWSGASDLLGRLMRERGVVHRHFGLRLALRSPGAEPVTVAMRHVFRGRSMYNPAHGVARGAREGWRDDVLLGGHIHVSGDQKVVDPGTGHISHCFQLGAFKRFDSYVDAQGFVGHHLAPGVALVIDPARPSTDPQRVAHFYDPEAAVGYLGSL